MRLQLRLGRKIVARGAPPPNSLRILEVMEIAWGSQSVLLIFADIDFESKWIRIRQSGCPCTRTGSSRLGILPKVFGVANLAPGGPSDNDGGFCTRAWDGRFRESQFSDNPGGGKTVCGD